MHASRRDVLKWLALLPLLTMGRPLFADTPLTPIRINIPGPHSLPFLPIELIPILGLDHQAGVQLIIRYFPSGISALEDMLAGNAQFSAQGFSVLPAYYKRDQSVRALAPLNGAVPPYAIVVRSDLRDKIRTVSQLKGRSIGTSMGSPTSKTYLQHVTEIFLAANGVQPHELRWVPTAQNREGQLAALTSKSVDAVMCEEPFITTLVHERAGFVLSDFSKPGSLSKIPGMGHVRATLTTSVTQLKQNPAMARLMLNLLNQSLLWMGKAGPQGIARQLPLPTDSARNEMQAVLKRQAGMYPADAHFSRRQLDATSEFLHAAGLVDDAGFDLAVLIADDISGVKP